RRIYPILNVDGGQIRIAGQIESDRNLAGPVISAGRSDVLHSLCAIDLLLKRDRNRALHRLRARSDISAGDTHLRRSQIWKLSDRRSGKNSRSRQNDQHGANRSEHRAAYEKLSEHEISP